MLVPTKKAKAVLVGALNIREWHIDSYYEGCEQEKKSAPQRATYIDLDIHREM
jgi:hypothetical protein